MDFDSGPTSRPSNEPDLLTAATSVISMDTMNTDDHTGIKQHGSVQGIDDETLQRNEDINLDDFVDVITTYSCKFCDFSCAAKSILIDHLRSVHIGHEASNQALVFLCGVCNQSFIKLDKCKFHMMQKHPPETANATTRLNRNVRSTSQDRGNPQSQSQVSEKESLCVTSDSSMIKRKTRRTRALKNYSDTPNNEQKQRRIRRKGSIRNNALKCEMAGCNAFFKTNEALDFHNQCHVTANTFRCPGCNQLEDDWCRMASHTCPSRTRLQNWCTECERTFADSKCLKKHKNVIHGRLKPYVCQVCGHAFARRATLALHARQHTAEKPHKCDQCDFATVDPSTLRRHRMRHSGEKRYKCLHCPYACIQAIAFKMHLKSKHPGQTGLHHCQLCDFVSVNHDNLLSHKQTHANRPLLQLESKNVDSICVEGSSKGETRGQMALDNAQDLAVQTASEQLPVVVCNGATAAQHI